MGGRVEGEPAMKHNEEGCRYEMAYSVQFHNLREDLSELKHRVHGLESTLGRGVMLLVANLVGIAIMLARQALHL